MVAVISFYVQSFFCYRLYALSKMCCARHGAIRLGPDFCHNPDLPHSVLGAWQTGSLVSVYHATPFVGDVLLSSTTAWFLLKNRKHVLPHTASLPNALVRLTFQTAALPAICAMINLDFIYTGDHYSTNVVAVFI